MQQKYTQLIRYSVYAAVISGNQVSEAEFGINLKADTFSVWKKK